MADARIEFQLGKLAFSGEGSEKWLADQLAFVISKVPDLTVVADLVEPEPQTAQADSTVKKQVAVGSLASHIKTKGGDSNQAMRFLATADWLRLKGDTNLKPASVSKALQENHQKKLANPADCLNKNVAKGLCEKTAEGFFVTPEGLTVLGHNG
jgi:hypothetical protein